MPVTHGVAGSSPVPTAIVKRKPLQMDNLRGLWFLVEVGGQKLEGEGWKLGIGNQFVIAIGNKEKGERRRK